MQGMLALVKNKCTRWIFIGGCLRFWQGYTISYFALKYFDIFNMPKMYSLLNALAVLFGGFASNMFAGIVCDKYENVNYRTKAHVAAIMSLLAVPVCALCFLIYSSFYFSMTMLFLEYLLCEGWLSPSISMIQTVIDVEHKATSIGVFMFGVTISGTLSSIVVGDIC